MMNRTVTAFEKMIVLAEEYLENKILFDDFIEPFEDEFAATLDVPKLDFFYLDDYNTVSLDRNPIETYYDYYKEIISESDMLEEHINFEMQYMKYKWENVINQNMKMAGKIVEAVSMNPNKKYFFAFGAEHFLGKNSIVDFLERIGFKVERATAKVEPKSRQDSKFHSNISNIETFLIKFLFNIILLLSYFNLVEIIFIIYVFIL